MGSIWLTPKPTYAPNSRKFGFSSGRARLASAVRIWERRSPPFPGGTHAPVAPAPGRGAEPDRGGTDSAVGCGARPDSGGQPSARSRPQRGGLKPPVLGPRASDAGKCPHPGNPRRTAAAAAAATRSGRQNGGGGGGLVLRGELGPRDPASGRAGRPQPPACDPPCPHPERPQGPRDGLRPPRRRPSGPRPLSGSPAVPRRLITSVIKDFNIPGNIPFHLCSEGSSESVA